MFALFFIFRSNFAMPAKMTFTVFDEVHDRHADGIEYDLWRIEKDSKRVNLGHKTFNGAQLQTLVEANKPEELGSFEIVLYVKEYFDRFNENIKVQDARYVLPFGMNNADEEGYLGIRINPDSYTCTL